MNKILGAIIKNYDKSDQARWRVCVCASMVVGEYREGAAEEIRAALKLSDVSQVHNLAYAGKAFRTLQQFGPMLELRSRLRISHWTSSWPYLRDEEGDPRGVLAMLRLAAEQAWSSKEYESRLRESFGQPPRPKKNEAYWRQIVSDEMWSRAEMLETVEDRETALSYLRWLKERKVL